MDDLDEPDLWTGVAFAAVLGSLGWPLIQWGDWLWSFVQQIAGGLWTAATLGMLVVVGQRLGTKRALALGLVGLGLAVGGALSWPGENQATTTTQLWLVLVLGMAGLGLPLGSAIARLETATGHLVRRLPRTATLPIWLGSGTRSVVQERRARIAFFAYGMLNGDLKVADDAAHAAAKSEVPVVIAAGLSESDAKWIARWLRGTGAKVRIDGEARPPDQS
jgi:hypothetical protein